jgi:hypothetical protein
MTQMGHEEQFSPPTLSARYGIRQETFAGTHGNGRDAPTADLRELGSIVVGSSQRGRKDRATLSHQTLGYRPNPHSARRREANFNKLRELHRSEPTLANATTALLFSITGDAPYAALRLAHEHDIRR